MRYFIPLPTDTLNRYPDESEVKIMKVLSARQYLGQLELIDEQINQDLERLDEMKQSAASTGSFDYSRERVQTSPVGDKLCTDVTRYVALDEQINREIDNFVDAKEQIIKEIRGLRHADYVRVLYKIYVQYKSIKDTAFEMGRSYKFVRDVHKKALEAFEKTYPNRRYLT